LYRLLRLIKQIETKIERRKNSLFCNLEGLYQLWFRPTLWVWVPSGPPFILVLLKLVSFQIKLGPTLRCNKIEDFSAFFAAVFLVFAFLYCCRATFWAVYFNSWRFFFLHSFSMNCFGIKDYDSESASRPQTLF